MLTIDAAAAEVLPEPGKNPAAMEVSGEDFVEREWDDELEGKLKRAWDFLSGKRTEDHRGYPGMAVREATEADVDALAPLLRGYADFYESSPTRRRPRGDGARRDRGARGPGLPAGRHRRRRRRSSASRSTSGSGRACAAPGWWCMDDLFVAESARGAGHADALIEAVAEVARRHGAPILSWFTMPDNKRAHTVYDRVGGTAETLLEYELEL